MASGSQQASAWLAPEPGIRLPAVGSAPLIWVIACQSTSCQEQRWLRTWVASAPRFIPIAAGGRSGSRGMNSLQGAQEMTGSTRSLWAMLLALLAGFAAPAMA